jgi:hypothetical protein
MMRLTRSVVVLAKKSFLKNCPIAEFADHRLVIALTNPIPRFWILCCIIKDFCFII